MSEFLKKAKILILNIFKKDKEDVTLKLYEEIRTLKDGLSKKNNQVELLKDLILECRGISVGLNRLADIIEEIGFIPTSNNIKNENTIVDLKDKHSEQSDSKKIVSSEEDMYIPSIDTSKMEITQKSRFKKVISGVNLETSLSQLESVGPGNKKN